MKGHTGATLSLGRGCIYSGSWKQRLVARSSTESELIGVYDALPQVLWTKQFLEEQGWSNSATVMYQDNTSSILLERNGWSSSTKRTKHMNIRYFYVTEQVQNNTIHVTHCPMDEMVGDFFTKPLQGSLFLKMRNYIMGNEEPGYQDLPRSVLSIQKQKSIGTRKHDSEAGKTTPGRMGKDSDGSTRDMSVKNIQRMSNQMESDDGDGCGDDNTRQKRRGSTRSAVEPRSYRDVLMNSTSRQTMT